MAAGLQTLWILLYVVVVVQYDYSYTDGVQVSIQECFLEELDSRDCVSCWDSVQQQGVLRSWCCCLTCRQTACCPELKTLVKYHHLQNALNHGSWKSAEVYPQGQTRLVRLDQVFTLSLTVLRDQIERRYQAGFLLVQSPGHIFVSRALAIIIRVWYE